MSSFIEYIEKSGEHTKCLLNNIVINFLSEKEFCTTYEVKIMKT